VCVCVWVCAKLDTLLHPCVERVKSPFFAKKNADPKPENRLTTTTTTTTTTISTSTTIIITTTTMSILEKERERERRVVPSPPRCRRCVELRRSFLARMRIAPILYACVRKARNRARLDHPTKCSITTTIATILLN